MSKPAEFQFDVNNHQYEGVCHSPTQGGIVLMARIGEILTEPLMGLMAGGDIDLDSNLDTLAKAGPGLAAAFGKLAEHPQIVTAICRLTHRDGKPLAKEAHFDEAYRGNYMELAQALFHICRENGFVPLDAISKKASETQEGEGGAP